MMQHVKALIVGLIAFGLLAGAATIVVLHPIVGAIALSFFMSYVLGVLLVGVFKL